MRHPRMNQPGCCDSWVPFNFLFGGLAITLILLSCANRNRCVSLSEGYAFWGVVFGQRSEYTTLFGSSCFDMHTQNDGFENRHTPCLFLKSPTRCVQ